MRAGVSEAVAMSITGHKTRSVFDRYHIVSSADQVEAVRKLANLHGVNKPGTTRVIALGEAVSDRTGTLRAQLRRPRQRSNLQVVAALQRELASPTGFEPVLPP